jgi:hypothetical protein
MRHLVALGIGLLILLFMCAAFSLVILAFVKPMIGVPIFLLVLAYLLGSSILR